MNKEVHFLMVSARVSDRPHRAYLTITRSCEFPEPRLEGSENQGVVTHGVGGQKSYIKAPWVMHLTYEVPHAGPGS